MLNESEVRDLNTGDMLTFLHGVNAGALRLRRLVENFIQLVELETGEAQRTFNLRKVTIENIRTVFEHAMEYLHQANPERVINPITYEIDPNLPHFVGDPEFLRIAFMHLLDNAIKFSNPNQPIILSAAAKNGEIQLSVRDSGRGINPEEIEKIWDMFYQINRAYYEDQGVGAGLPIVRGIAQLHGGRVTLHSVLEQGSTFTLRLPVGGAAVASNPA
jgi:signal transduction histidine kinase